MTKFQNDEKLHNSINFPSNLSDRGDQLAVNNDVFTFCLTNKKMHPAGPAVQLFDVFFNFGFKLSHKMLTFFLSFFFFDFVSLDPFSSSPSPFRSEKGFKTKFKSNLNQINVNINRTASKVKHCYFVSIQSNPAARKIYHYKQETITISSKQFHHLKFQDVAENS